MDTLIQCGVLFLVCIRHCVWQSIHQAPGDGLRSPSRWVGFVHQAPGVDFLHQTGVFGLCSPPQGEDFLHQTGVVWTLFTNPGGGLPSPNWGHLDFVHHPRRRTSFTKLGSFGLCLPKHSAWTYFTKVGLFGLVNGGDALLGCGEKDTHVGQRGAHME